MNNLFQHIEYLLLRHDCVIVPGFGAFIVTESPARIDRELGKIIPPCRSVMFNQSVTIDDGLLANSFSRKENLSFEESRQVILKSVENIKSTLHASGHIHIGKLGEIVLGEEQTMFFKPTTLWSQSAEELGYHIVNLPSTEPDNKTEILPKLRFSYGFRKLVAAVAAILVIAVATVLNPLSPNDFQEERASVVPVEVLVNPKKALTDPAEHKTVMPEVADTLSLSTSPSPEEGNRDRYFLIVGTFTTSHEAERYAEKNRTEEYPLTVVPSRKVTRVALASSDNKEDLLPMLNSKIIASKFPNSWIWRE